jgi:hypothetical protein
MIVDLLKQYFHFIARFGKINLKLMLEQNWQLKNVECSKNG